MSDDLQGRLRAARAEAEAELEAGLARLGEVRDDVRARARTLVARSVEATLLDAAGLDSSLVRQGIKVSIESLKAKAGAEVETLALRSAETYLRLAVKLVVAMI